MVDLSDLICVYYVFRWSGLGTLVWMAHGTALAWLWLQHWQSVWECLISGNQTDTYQERLLLRVIRTHKLCFSGQNCSWMSMVWVWRKQVSEICFTHTLLKYIFNIHSFNLAVHCCIHECLRYMVKHGHYIFFIIAVVNYCFSASRFSIRPEHIVLVHDELDKPLGKLAIKHGGSARSETPLFKFFYRKVNKHLLNSGPFFMSFNKSQINTDDEFIYVDHSIGAKTNGEKAYAMWGIFCETDYIISDTDLYPSYLRYIN